MSLHGERPAAPIGLALLFLLLLALPVLAGYEDLEREIQEIELDNGLKILLLERHDVPVFSFWTYVNVGSVDEIAGKTGIAHMFEHMAFKGTKDIGTLNYKAEKKLLERMDDVYERIQEQIFMGRLKDEALLARLEGEFTELQTQAAELVDGNAFTKMVEANGGVGINAMTSNDATQYFYSFPSNRLELWVKLESDRFINPVLREFYKERGVVNEERNMRTDSQPQGRLFEEWLAAAYIGHPYGQSGIGYRSDLQTFSRRDAQEFYEEQYGARNMVIAVVGDVYYDELEKFAKKYFAKIPPGSGGVPVRTVEPRQLGERRVTIEESSQPFLFIGYHVYDAIHPDTPAVSAIADILGQGRSSRLNVRLVKEDKLAVFTGCFEGLPGERYPGLLTLVGIPNKDISYEDLETGIYEEVDRIVNGGITSQELDGFKTRARASFIKGLEDNTGIAGQLCYAEKIQGDWRELFTYLDKIDAVTPADVQRVAGDIFQKSNRTVGAIATVDDDS
jgi:predicted Zn-dependent peptidase